MITNRVLEPYFVFYRKQYIAIILVVNLVLMQMEQRMVIDINI